MTKLPIQERLVESAAAFRASPVYDSEGDGVLLTVQADECEQAAETIGELVAALERLTSERHTHVASTDGDRCYKCQRDLRDPVHYRRGEGPSTDWEFARAALAKARQP